MKFQKRSQTSAIVLALALSVSWVAPSRAQSATSQAQPDNTKVNKRDKNPEEAKRGRSESDREDPQIGHGRQDTLDIRSQRQDHQSKRDCDAKGSCSFR